MRHLQNDGIGLNSNTLLVIKLPDSRVLRIVSRSVFLAVLLLTLPWIGSTVKELSSTSNYNASAEEFISDFIDDVDVEFLDSLLLDLAVEGLIKKGDRTLFICSGIGAVVDNSVFLNAKEIDLISESDLGLEGLFHDAAFDFVLAFGYENIEFLDRIMNIGGILVTQLGDLPSALQKQSNYKDVYLHQYNSTIVAMRKTSLSNELVDSSVKRRLCELKLEAKKAALNGLEDVLLKPPRKILAKSRKDLRNFKYLPELLGDSLEDGRCVLIDVSLPAEKEVVEEMIRRGSISLVDELFLECKNQWYNVEGNKSKRVYWECLALYGRLRDKGVAVHQWWG